MSKPKNPQAFPIHARMEDLEEPGMTLLDYFAGQAIVNIASAELLVSLEQIGARAGGAGDIVAVFAYDIAEAMLKEREKHDEN